MWKNGAFRWIMGWISAKMAFGAQLSTSVVDKSWGGIGALANAPETAQKIPVPSVEGAGTLAIKSPTD